MANRSQKARMLREKRKGRFARWKNNPRGGVQAPLKRYSMKSYSTPSQDVELYNNQTLGARRDVADTSFGIKHHGRLPSKSKLDTPIFLIQPETKDLTFARVIGEDGPIPRLLVLDRMKQVKKEDWFQDWEYDKWINEFYHISLIKSLYHRVDIIFRGQIFIIVEVGLGWARRSRIYDSFERAKRAWDRERVGWVERIRV